MNYPPRNPRHYKINLRVSSRLCGPIYSATKTQSDTKLLEPLMDLNALMFYKLSVPESQAIENQPSCFFVASRLRGPIYSATKTPRLKVTQSSWKP